MIGRFVRRADDLLASPDGHGLPPPARVVDALVGPLLPGSGKRRQIFHADTNGVSLDHLRAAPGHRVYSSSTVSPFPEPPLDPAVVDEPALWAGPYMNHFGHMAADGIHRLWAAKLLPELRESRIVYHLGPGRTMAITPWFAELLGMFDIAPERVLFLNEPTRFAELHVPAQGRVLGGAVLLDAYLDIFPLLRGGDGRGARRPIYVSRQRHMHTGTYLGESHVEAELARAGFEIAYPEDMPIADMVAKLLAAPLIVFCEGSAVHNLDLCGRVDARIFVIGRRPGTHGRFTDTLSAACDDWEVFAAGQGGIGLDWDRSAGQPHGAHTCSLIDLPELMMALARFTGLALPIPDAATARDAAARDLFGFLMNPRTGDLSNDEQFGRLMRDLRARPDIRALLPDAPGTRDAALSPPGTR